MKIAFDFKKRYVIIILVLIGVTLVIAAVPNPGHALDELEVPSSCVDGNVVKLSSGVWVCGVDGGGSGGSVNSVTGSDFIVATPTTGDVVVSLNSCTVTEPYLAWNGVNWVCSSGPGSSGGVPAGAIMMFESTCPSGWSLYIAMQGRFPRGEPSSNPGSLDSGGSDDAVVVSHNHKLYKTGAGSQLPLEAVTQGGFIGPGTTLVTTTEGVSGTGKNMPAYREVIFCKKN
jgi:hypothetical protein